VTPTGRFTIYAKIAGWHESYLGWMYYPSYFEGGYAIHGDTYVPPFPVSHGCIRMPDWLAVGFWSRNHIGTPVIVR
jgi:lipoprotein-anchoring transpeptidase ErfK/SrfK